MPNRIRVGVAILAGVTFLVLLAGAASASTHATAKYGGTLVVGLSGGEPDSLDPTLSRGLSAVAVFRVICEQLYGLDARSQLDPVLAAALPAISKDKLTYTIQLRQGIQFNDGTPFNAQAVVTSVERHMTYPDSSRASSYANVDGVRAAGPYTVVFHLRERDASFNGSAFVLSPTQLARAGDDFATNPVCVGPFMFDHRVAGDSVTVVKSPYYYDQKHVYLDKIVFKSVPDAAAAVAALKAGDIQLLDSVSTTELRGVQETSNLRVIKQYQHGWKGILINIGNANGVGKPPFTNVGTPLSRSAKLRQAFEVAIDRDRMNRVVFGGLMQPSCTPIAPANTAWYDATKVACTPYDPAHARKLIAESGFSKPTVRLLMANTTDNLRLAAFLQVQEAEVGINVVIETTDNATDVARRTSGDFDADLSGFFPTPVDPDFSIHQFFTIAGVRNYGGYVNPRLDLILRNGRKATSMQARSTLYRVAQQIIATDRPFIYLYNQITFAAFSAKLTGVRLTGAAFSIANAQYR